MRAVAKAGERLVDQLDQPCALSPLRSADARQRGALPILHAAAFACVTARGGDLADQLGVAVGQALHIGGERVPQLRLAHVRRDPAADPRGPRRMIGRAAAEEGVMPLERVQKSVGDRLRSDGGWLAAHFGQRVEPVEHHIGVAAQQLKDRAAPARQHAEIAIGDRIHFAETVARARRFVACGAGFILRHAVVIDVEDAAIAPALPHAADLRVGLICRVGDRPCLGGVEPGACVVRRGLGRQ